MPVEKRKAAMRNGAGVRGQGKVECHDVYNNNLGLVHTNKTNAPNLESSTCYQESGDVARHHTVAMLGLVYSNHQG